MSYRIEILKNIMNEEVVKFAKKEKIYDFSYSAILRYLRKNQDENVEKFIKTFKESFDIGCEEELEDFENLALMQACKFIDLDLKNLLE